MKREYFQRNICRLLCTWIMYPLKLESSNPPADGELNLVQWLCMIPEGSRAPGAFRIRFAFELRGFKDSWLFQKPLESVEYHRILSDRNSFFAIRSTSSLSVSKLANLGISKFLTGRERKKTSKSALNTIEKFQERFKKNSSNENVIKIFFLLSRWIRKIRKSSKLSRLSVDYWII